MPETEMAVPEPITRLDEMFCGCGEPETVWTWVRDYLAFLRPGSGGWPFKPETGPEYLAVYILDHLELTDHGSTIRCPFLTDVGEEVLAFLEANGPNWKDKTASC